MIKIKVEDILNELRKLDLWREYENKLAKYAREKDIKLDFLIGKEGIEKIIENPNFNENVFNISWKDRSKKFKCFYELEQIFKLKFLEKYKFCPLCGKTPLVIYETKNGTSQTFDLDHFFPKKKYNFLMFNFYNLVPLCKSCNQRKGQINYLKASKIKVGNKFFHTYFGGYEKKEENKNTQKYFKEVELNFDFVKGLNELKKWKNLEHIPAFYLETKYSVNETFNIFQFIYDKYTQIKDEYSRFKKDSKSVKEFVECFLKNYYPEKEQEILKYSNGKLKKDLVENMKKILEEDLKKDK